MRSLRSALPAAASCVATLCIVTLAGAGEPPPAGAPAALPYQVRMKACHAEARGRKGMARCEFLRECLHGGAPAVTWTEKGAGKDAEKGTARNAGKAAGNNPERSAEKTARKEVEKKTGKASAESAPAAPPE